MVLLELLWSFVKIGFTSFGGLSMIPLITSEVFSHGWMTAGEVSDIVAIAEMTPGPLGLNCATFAGIHAAGIPGAHVKNNKYMEHILVGVRPACLGMIVGVMCSLYTNYLGAAGNVNLPAVTIGGLDLFLLLKCRLGVPAVIGISALLGLLCFGVLGWQ